MLSTGSSNRPPTVYSGNMHANTCKMDFYLCFRYLSTFDIRYFKSFTPVLLMWVTFTFTKVIF